MPAPETAINPWLASIPPALAADILGNPIDKSLATFRETFRDTFQSIDSTTTNAFDVAWCMALFLKKKGNFDPNSLLSDLITHLASSLIARRWKADMTHGLPTLAQDLISLDGEFIFDKLTPQRLSGCALLLSLAIGGASGIEVWQAVFEIFNPSDPTPPASSRGFRTQQTPVKCNSGSLVSDSTTHAVLDPLIRSELDGLVFPNTSGFFETYFPINTTVAYQGSSVHRRKEDNTWQGWPSPPEEQHVLSWFRSLANNLLISAGLPRRYCTAPSTPLRGSAAARKPDIFLYPSSANDMGAYHWQNVLVVCEVKKNHTRDPSVAIIVQLANYIREIFPAQNTRRFVHAFTLCGDYIRCWVFHRGGAVGSTEFSINGDPQRFVNVVVGYAAMTDAQLGLDTTLTFNELGMTIPGCLEPFVVEKIPFFHRKAIASRGTTCWNAVGMKSGVRYVLKDSWRSSKYENEGVLLAKTKQLGVVGIVEYVAHQDVVIEGVVDDLEKGVMGGLRVGKKGMKLCYDFTSLDESREPEGSGGKGASASMHRRGSRKSSAQMVTLPCTSPPASPTKRPAPDCVISPHLSSSHSSKRIKPSPSSKQRIPSPTSTITVEPFPNRIHTRILMVKGRAITDFESPPELLHALHGAITGHRSLLAHGILHRDISINNIMITPSDHPRPDGLHGFLIDLDLSILLSSPTLSGAPHRTGTMEFMAIGALDGSAHTYRHDLESFFYVFLWICCCRYTLSGSFYHKPVLHGWTNRNTWEGAAACKFRHMSEGVGGFGKVLEGFEDWAEGLKGLADEWRKCLFPIRNGGMWIGTDIDEGPLYERILGVLEKGLGEISS